MSAYYNRGQTKIVLHDYQGAIVDYSAAINLDPKYGTYYFARGMARFALKDYPGTISDLTKSIELEPTKRAEAYVGRGLSVVLASSEYIGAYFGKELTASEVKAIHEVIRDFTTAIELKPAFTEAYSGRGIAKNILKDYQGALLDLNKAIDIDSSFGEAYAHRGITRLFLGNESQGCLDLEKAGALGYAEAFNLIKRFCK
jgi:tetratricopeptide (TPR) repeat protein